MTSASPETPEPSHSDIIDRICDQFEALLHRREQPRIEEFLPLVPDPAREGLLRELVALEIDYRKDPGDTLPFAPYFLRFPQFTAALNALQAEWDERHEDSAGFEVASSPKPMDETVAFTGASQRFRHFELISVIGKGGFGIVWHAKDLKLQRDVAIKFPRKERLVEIDKSLFLREARAAANLRNPHIVAVYEVGDEGQQTYIVSELIDGQNLKEYLRAASVSPREAALLVAKLASAVHHAHEHGIIHRDLKPANVLIDGQQEPHITDFGLAKREAADESISVAGHMLGTPTYMAPEQASGDHRAIDARTDIYALGVILYELLTGGPPFRGEQTQLLRQVREAPPAPPRIIKPDIPKDLEAICLKCLEKDRAKRYTTGQALADDLHLFLNGETLRGILAPIHDRAWKWYRRNRRQILIASSVSLVAAVTTGILAWCFSPPPPPTELRTVEFQTEPQGCRIWAVKIDPKTGEPDPTDIKHKAGLKTPLTMKLSPGDYLVVAVLASDETWFHEVYRHVPGKAEPPPYSARHLSWKEKENARDVLEVSKIVLSRPDVTRDMVFVEGSDAVKEQTAKGEISRTWRLPAFYVDPREVSILELKNWLSEETLLREVKDSPDPLLRQILWVGELEKQGKRLPSAAELYYLSTVVCPVEPCVLVDNKLVEGVHSDPWEWTMTKPGGPFSGRQPAPTGLSTTPAFIPRMMGCGDANGTNSKLLSPTGFIVKEEYSSGVAGARGVRSFRPRRSRDDFAAPLSLSEQSAH